MIRRLRNLARAFLVRDEGTASVEFVLCVPVVMFIFMASFESGLAMVRSILLERSVDMVMRELRLGHYEAPVTNQFLKEQICGHEMMMTNCVKQMKIDMQAISRTTWTMPTGQAACIDRTTDEIDPVVQMTIGQQNVIMLVRVCVIQDAIFPTTGIGRRLQVDGSGYRVTSISSFVNEPG
ncbi:MAG: TadE/TadG family type IV pilus assembly protein [Paracoccaceae bacterium]